MNKGYTLRWQMLRMIALGWFLPLALVITVFFFAVAKRIDLQTERTIDTSMEKAVELCSTRLSDCIAASKDTSYLPDIKDAWNTYQKDGNLTALKNTVSLFLAQNYRYDPNFDLTVLIFCDEPEIIYYTGNETGRGSTFRLRYFKDNAYDEALKRLEAAGTEVSFFASGEHIYLIRNVMTRNFTPYAIQIMELNTARVFGSLDTVWAYRGMAVWYGDEKLTGSGDINYEYNGKADVTNSVYMANDGADSVICYLRHDDNGDLFYAVGFDKRAVNIERNSVIGTFALMIIFLVPLTILVLHFFQKKVSEPISTLTDASKEIAAGNYGVTVDETRDGYEGEIADLTHNFNRMSDKLSEQFNRILVEEIELRDANIHALQSQINPHFLNNTLEIINWEARMHGDDKVSSMIEALSVMMDATMDRDRKSLITLSQEMEYVRAYLYIMECRYSDRFIYNEDIDEKLMNVEVPRLIIQPVIENAVEYGIEDNGGKRISLRISGYADDNKVDMQIIITNPGMLSDEDREKIAGLLKDEETNAGDGSGRGQSSRIGIRNVNRRLKMIYGDESGLIIEDDGSGHTVSTIFVKN